LSRHIAALEGALRSLAWSRRSTLDPNEGLVGGFADAVPQRPREKWVVGNAGFDIRPDGFQGRPQSSDDGVAIYRLFALNWGA